jgi:hypothetical protein
MKSLESETIFCDPNPISYLRNIFFVFFLSSCIMSAHSPTIFHSLFAGSVSGMASIAVCHPFDVLRTKMQLNSHLSIATVFQSDMKNGFLSFYKGITGPFFAQALYKSIIFASNTMCHRYLFSDVYSSFTIFCSGTIAGTVNSLVVAPVEIVRTRKNI